MPLSQGKHQGKSAERSTIEAPKTRPSKDCPRDQEVKPSHHTVSYGPSKRGHPPHRYQQGYIQQRPAQYHSPEHPPHHFGAPAHTRRPLPFNTNHHPGPPVYHDRASPAAPRQEYRAYESQPISQQPNKSYGNHPRKVPLPSRQYSIVDGIGNAKINNGQIALLTDTIPRYITDASVIRNVDTLDINGGHFMMGDTRSVSHLMKANAPVRRDKGARIDHVSPNIDDDE